MLNIAHRGFSGKYPENTLLAFQKGIEAGADGFEFDTHLTKDGEIVIIHDERLDRTTNAQGFVKDYTLEELRKVDASKPFPECGFCGIPTLREYFELIRGRNLLTNIELKNGIFWYEGMEEKVIAMIREYGLEERVILFLLQPPVGDEVQGPSTGDPVRLPHHVLAGAPRGIHRSPGCGVLSSAPPDSGPGNGGRTAPAWGTDQHLDGKRGCRPCPAEGAGGGGGHRELPGPGCEILQRLIPTESQNHSLS